MYVNLLMFGLIIMENLEGIALEMYHASKRIHSPYDEFPEGFSSISK